MPSVSVVQDLGGGRTLVQVVGGTYDGSMVVLTPASERSGIRSISWYLEGDGLPAPTRRAPMSPADRANELLESLLCQKQLEDWRRRKHFWVRTPRGSVELGTVSHLRFIDSTRDRELILCVLPGGDNDEARLPEADIWTNLLLMLHSDPERFFRTANWRYPKDRTWWWGPIPG